MDDLRGINFGTVTGHFVCSNNRIHSLKGAPKEVGRDLSCGNNKIQSLEGSPETVGGNFYCSNNNLQSLEGAPKEVEKDFVCYDNPLLTLEGAPLKIGGIFMFGTSNETVSVEWSTPELVDKYLKLSGKNKDLLGTIVSPEALQKKIDAEPEKMAVELKSIVRLPEYQDLKWPKGLKSEVDLLSNLDRVGF